MSRLQSALSLALIALIGFLRLTWQLGQKRNKILFAREFLGQFQKLVQRFPSLDTDAYNWLTQRSVRMQNEMGQLGRVTYRPAFENYRIRDYQLIVNTLGGLRTGASGSPDIVTCEDALLRYIGVRIEEFNAFRHTVFNPLSWLQEAIRFFLSTPLYVLQSLGLAAASTVRLIINSRIFRALAGLVALIGLVSSIVTITLGWKTFLGVVNRVRLHSGYSISPGLDLGKASTHTKPPVPKHTSPVPNPQSAQPHLLDD